MNALPDRPVVRDVAGRVVVRLLQLQRDEQLVQWRLPLGVNLIGSLLQHAHVPLECLALLRAFGADALLVERIVEEVVDLERALDFAIVRVGDDV